jgi:hypothetical protein
METESAWRVRRVALSVLLLLVVALPLYPELYGLDEVTPFTQLVAFRPQALVVVLVIGLLMLLRPGWRIAAAVAKVIRERHPDLVSLPEAQVDVRQQILAKLQGLHGGILPSKFRAYKIVGTDHLAVVAAVAVPKSG